MSIHHKYILPLLGLACALSACSDDMPPTESAEAEQNVVLRLSLSPFANDPSPRSTLDGLAWEAGDGFRMRITCPYTTDHQNGELWSSGYHNLTFPADMGATVVFGPISSNQSQATTYIYTAQNTTGTRTFVVNDYRYKRPSNSSPADQSSSTNSRRAMSSGHKAFGRQAHRRYTSISSTRWRDWTLPWTTAN